MYILHVYGSAKIEGNIVTVREGLNGFQYLRTITCQVDKSRGYQVSVRGCKFQCGVDSLCRTYKVSAQSVKV